MTKQEAANYIRGKEHLLKNEDLDTLYEECDYLDRSAVTELFLEMGINPLLHMTRVPNRFARHLNIKSMDIPSDITSIGPYAFEYCSGLASVKIPDSVKSLDSYAFFGCAGLTNVAIGSGVEDIWDAAFEGCGRLTNIEIPNSLTSIHTSAFYKCCGLKGVYITDIAKWCDIWFGNIYSNPLYYAKNLYLNGKLVTDIVIPNGVIRLNCLVFYNCDSLTSITIPNSVTIIRNYAFGNCGRLTSIRYVGSKEEWNSIDKSNDWDKNTGNYTVHCIDGDIHKGES